MTHAATLTLRAAVLLVVLLSSPTLTAARSGSVRLSRKTLQGLNRADAVDSSKACSRAPPAVCGLRYVEATKEALYEVRIQNRYREIPLRGAASIQRGQSVIVTSVDLSGDIFAGAVLRVGNSLPLLAAGDAGPDGIPLVDPYNGEADISGAAIAAINLQLTPGVYDAQQGVAEVLPTVGTSVASTVPVSIAVAAAAVKKADSAVKTAPVGTLAPGDHIVFAGIVGAVAERVHRSEPAGAASESSVVAPFGLQAAYPYSSSARQRVFRFLPLPQFPGVSQRLIDAWMGKKGRGGGLKPFDYEDETEALISRVAGEADNLFPAAEMDAANAAVAATLMSVRLPGAVSVAHGSSDVASSVDLRAYLAPGSVVKIGGRAPFMLAPDAPVMPAAFMLDSSYAGPASPAASIDRLLDVEPLPGTVSLIEGGAALAASADVRSYIAPGEVLLLMTTPMRLVAVESIVEGGGAGSGVAVAGSGAAAGPSVVRLLGSGHAMPPVGPHESLRFFRAGYRLAVGCSVALKSGSPVVEVTGCDARAHVRATDELFFGDLIGANKAAGDGDGSSGPTRPWTAQFEPTAPLEGAAASPPPPVVAGVAAPGPAMPWLVATQEGSTVEVVSTGRFLLAAPYTGPSAAGVPLYRSGAQQLPGTTDVTQGSGEVRAKGFDARPALQSGDVLQLGAWLPSVVAGGALPPIPLGDGAAVALPIAQLASGGAVDDSASSPGGIAKATFHLREPLLLPSAAGLRGRKYPRRLLAGRLAFAGASNVVYTSADLRQFVSASSVLRIAGFTHLLPASTGGSGGGAGDSAAGSADGRAVAVAGAASLTRRSPVDFPVGPSRITMAWQLAETASPLLSLYKSEGVAASPGAYGGAFAATRCPVMPVLSQLAQATLSDAARAVLGSKAVECVGGLPVGDHRVWVAGHLDTSAPLFRLDKPSEELAYRQLPGTVAVIAGSPIVSTTADLTGYMAIGDIVVMGAALTPTFTIAAAPTYGSFRLTAPHPGPTASGLPLAVQYRRVRLSSTLDVTFGSPTAGTHSDIRGEVIAGDTIEVSSSLTGVRVVREFIVVPPLTLSSITLSEAYAGASETGCAAYRLVGGAGPGLLLPGTVTVAQGSDLVRSTEDLSGSVRSGDRLRVATFEVQAAEPITPEGLTLTAAYMGTSASGLRAYNLGRTSQALTLEQLGRLKLQCRSIFCLAKIEEMERAVPTDITRSLNAAALLPPGSGDGSGSAVGDRDALLAQQAAAEAAVEREWRAWYMKAKSQLGLLDGATGGASAPAGSGPAQVDPAAAQAAAAAAAGAAADGKLYFKNPQALPRAQQLSAEAGHDRAHARYKRQVQRAGGR